MAWKQSSCIVLWWSQSSMARQGSQPRYHRLRSRCAPGCVTRETEGKPPECTLVPGRGLSSTQLRMEIPIPVQDHQQRHSALKGVFIPWHVAPSILKPSTAPQISDSSTLSQRKLCFSQGLVLMSDPLQCSLYLFSFLRLPLPYPSSPGIEPGPSAV